MKKFTQEQLDAMRPKRNHAWRTYGKYGKRPVEIVDDDEIEEYEVPPVRVRRDKEDRNWADEIMNPE